jgi:hypothetical protein
MAIIVTTQRPQELLDAIYEGIDDGSIRTWDYDNDGDFTHTKDQFVNRAWLSPIVGSGELKFGIIGQRGVPMTKGIYGIYHGRFIEMLLSHFDHKFSQAVASAQFVSGVDPAGG